jgi:CBS domain-containing protein
MHADAPVVRTDTLLNDIPAETAACAVVREGAAPAALSRTEIEVARARGRGTDPVAVLLTGRYEIPYLYADESVEDALDRMYEAEADAIAIVARGDVTRVLGVVTLAAVQGVFRKPSQNEAPSQQ